MNQPLRRSPRRTRPGRRILRAGAAAGLAATLFATLATGYARADFGASPSGDPSWGNLTPAEIGNQDSLGTFRDEFLSNAQWNSHYLTSADDLADNAMTIYWYGSASADTETIAREARERGISVTFEFRKYSLAQRMAAAEAVLDGDYGPTIDGITPTVVMGFDPSFDGIIIGGLSDAARRRGAQGVTTPPRPPTHGPRTILGIPVEVSDGWFVTLAEGRASSDDASGRRAPAHTAPARDGHGPTSPILIPTPMRDH